MLEALYENSPIWLQNVFVALAGARLHVQREGGRHAEVVRAITNNEKLTPEAMEEVVFASLKQLLEQAFERVPFYKEWSSKNGVVAADFKSKADISALPIIGKEEIRENPRRFCDEVMLAKGGIFTLNTSGTTGKPLTVFCDETSRRRHYAYWRRFLHWWGIEKNSWRATFCGRVAVPQAQTSPPFWRIDPMQRNVLFSSYHLSESNMAAYVKKLREMEPSYLEGYPSSLAFIARYMLAKQEAPPTHLKTVITSAETLSPLQREVITRAFGAPVADQYGCTEMAVFVSQCRHGSYHVNSDYGLLEVVNGAHQPASPGEVGEVVATGLVNKIMPLVRYRLGDMVTAPEMSSCPCGLPFPVIKELWGRQDDLIVTPDGRRIGRLDPVLKGLENIKECQVVQNDRQNLQVKLVVTPLFTEVEGKKLLHALRTRIGDGMAITIEVVEKIPRTANGKFRAVISSLGRSEQ